ncbi:MAG: hypothetical protein AAF481_14045 [Acidobacteriota bacterium]
MAGGPARPAGGGEGFESLRQAEFRTEPTAAGVAAGGEAEGPKGFGEGAVFGPQAGAVVVQHAVGPGLESRRQGGEARPAAGRSGDRRASPGRGFGKALETWRCRSQGIGPQAAEGNEEDRAAVHTRRRRLGAGARLRVAAPEERNTEPQDRERSAAARQVCSSNQETRRR